MSITKFKTSNCLGWQNARGFRIEHDAAVVYGLITMRGLRDLNMLIAKYEGGEERKERVCE